MTIERAKRLAEQWASGGVCSTREGEAEEYHKMFLEMLLEKKARESNGPLTLDELRQMGGEPVRIERVGRTEQSDAEWALVNCEDALCRTSGGCAAFFELYGISWLAYRNKPEGGADNG